MKFDEFEKLVQQRRSWYPTLFTEELIPDVDVEACLRLAALAPTHRLTQPWRFKILNGENLNRLGDFLAQKYKVNTPASSFNESKHSRTAKKPTLCSHVVAFVLHRDQAESVPEWEELAALSTAVMTFWLAVTAKGYGGYWSTPKYLTTDKQFFDLADNETCYGIFYLGVPDKTATMHTRTYLPFDAITQWN